MFIDEANIYVEAGHGGHGCLSFRREKFIPMGGPDGGDGGRGGHVYIVATSDLNTLESFRYQRKYKAKNGIGGAGANRTGARGVDMQINVPVGTLVYQAGTRELIADLKKAGDSVLVARGGEPGLGNARFKSSTNRAPRQTTQGEKGEERQLQLELQLLADVGLLGLPNAGKSTLVRQLSNATPKVADYPFTTLHPQLGVVQVGACDSFVLADIPGLIAGASQGAGLGSRFLKHLSRVRLLLHLVDLLPVDGSEPADNIVLIQDECRNYSRELADKPQWLVFNKCDLMSSEEAARLAEEICQKIGWEGSSYVISGATGLGAKRLAQAAMQHLVEGEENLT